MSLNIDYVRDENDNVNVKYYSIDPSSYIGKLAFPITRTSQLFANLEVQEKRDSNTTRTKNSDIVTSAIGNEERMSNSTTFEDTPMRPEDTSVKDSSQGELNEKQEGSSHYNLSPEKVNPFPKSSANEDFEDEKKRDIPDLDLGITTGEVRVHEVDCNQNSRRANITEAEAMPEDHKEEATPMASNIQNLDSTFTNCKPFDEMGKTQQESPKGNELYFHCSPQNIKICKVQNVTNKAAKGNRYSDKFRIQVMAYSKFNNRTQRATAKIFGVPQPTVAHWCRTYYQAYNFAVGVLDEIIEAALKSGPDEKVKNHSSEFSSSRVLSEAKIQKSKIARRVKYPTELRGTVLSYVKTHTHAKAAKKFNVSLRSIKQWKEKQSGRSSDVSQESESFEDLYSDEDALGSKKRKRREISKLGLDSSGDDDDANSLGVCKKRNERESTPKSKVENKVTRTSSDSHQLRMDVLDYGAKHSFEEASEVFKVDMETISSWLYY